MKKGLLFVALVAVACGSASAQLSTRDNNATNVRLGARPVAGDAALCFNIPIVARSENDGNDAGLYNGNLLGAGDVLTFKYYHTDDVAYRAGIRLFADNSTTKGTAADSTALTPITEGDVKENVKRTVNREYVLAGGLEKHFNATNVFDVYVGGDVLLGLGKDKTVDQEDYVGGDKNYMTMTTGTTIFGLGGVVGFNVFVAQLPVSVGLEYGLSGKWIFGGKTHVEVEQTVGSTSNTGDWYEQDVDGLGASDSNRYSKLSRRDFNMDTNHNVRLNIHIYFNSKSAN
jgi:hypothetical protein